MGEVIELKGLTTEQRNERTMRLDQMSPLEIVSVMNEEDENVIKGVHQALPEIAKAASWATEALGAGGRLIYMGAGTSGRLGVLDAVECPPTFGTEPEQVVGLIAGGDKAFLRAVEGAEDSMDLGRQDLQNLKLRKNDLVVGIAASGRTPYVIGGLRYAGEVGCRRVSVACNHGSAVGKEADCAIEVVSGPEVLTGSTRLKSGTAQKMVLNMISTAAMVGLGKAYENLMVDVQQTNQKLVTRAENMVMTAAHCDRDRAREALRQSGGSAKIAIATLLMRCSAEEARTRLRASGGKIRSALREAPKAASKGPYLMAMDGGGTATIVYITSPGGEILHRITGGPMNPNGAASGSVRHTLEDIFAQAAALGYGPETCLGVGLGVAGIGNPEVQGFLEEIFKTAGFTCTLGLWGDQETALAANIAPGRPGAILIAGTGSICVGREENGELVRTGGFGNIMDDGGSGYAIARDGLAAIVRAEDGRGPKTILRDMVLGELGLSDMGGLLKYLYAPERTKGEIAALAKLVSQAADQGDDAARRILEQAALDLTSLAKPVLAKLPRGAKLLYSGSVLKKNDRVRTRTLELLRQSFPEVDWEEAVAEAALGALRLIQKKREEEA